MTDFDLRWRLFEHKLARSIGQYAGHARKEIERMGMRAREDVSRPLVTTKRKEVWWR